MNRRLDQILARTVRKERDEMNHSPLRRTSTRRYDPVSLSQKEHYKSNNANSNSNSNSNSKRKRTNRCCRAVSRIMRWFCFLPLKIALILVLGILLFLLGTHPFRKTLSNHNATVTASTTRVVETITLPVIVDKTNLPKSYNHHNPSNVNNGGLLEPCGFRSYPPLRRYNVTASRDTLPDFLTGSTVLYIRGQWPFVLQTSIASSHAKLCIDASGWEGDYRSAQHYPFSDGQNPSIISLSAESTTSHNAPHTKRLKLPSPSISALRISPPDLDSHFLAVMVVGNAQCNWNMTPDQVTQYQFSPSLKPKAHQTLVLVLGPTFNTLEQSIVHLERDAPWGGKGRRPLPPLAGEKIVPHLDDPRFFFFQGRIWILYRQGPRFGYNDQIHNPLHFERSPDGSLMAYIKASETVTVCCGRNIALLSSHDDETNAPTLSALEWLDPVTIQPVNTSKVDDMFHSETTQQRRRLGAAKHKKSDMHGTNGFLVYLPSTQEWLGVGHMHRPGNRDDHSIYAFLGHHYTHSFFTIQKGLDGKFQLSRLSNEFLFPTKGHGDGGVKDDGDTIQFASGLDLMGSDQDGRLLLSYGINDCEGAALFLDMNVVQKLLLPVSPGMEVGDLMERLSS
eukprot:scaffold32535_cov44-Attheya_sp.AAC.6